MNINEIAKRAGVSRATVSRYLNDGYVSGQKREQIRKVIEETGYQPSAQAQTLRSRRTKLIGVILPKINSDSISRMVAGISQVISEKGYQLLLANTANDENEELKYLDLFRENQVDGVILIATIFTPRHKKILKDYAVPIVLLGQRLEGYSCVYQDDYQAAFDMTGRLLAGAASPAYIGVTERDVAVGQNRKQGFLDAAAQAGFSPAQLPCLVADFTLEAGAREMEKLLGSGIDAIFCATDTIAVGAMLALQDRGLRVPQDVALAGVGDSRLARVTTPRLSTVRFHYQTSGAEAARMLTDAIEAKDAVRRELKMGYELVMEGSCPPI